MSERQRAATVMDEAARLLHDLERRGWRLWGEADKLRYVTAEAPDEATLSLLKRHKAALLYLLAERRPSSAATNDAAPRDNEPFWRARLDAITPLELPRDRPRQPGPELIDEALHDLGAELTARVRGLAAAEETTPARVLLAALALLVQRHTGQDDVTVWTRPERGAVTEALPIRCSCPGTATLREWLRAIGDELRAVVDAGPPPVALRDALSSAARQVGFAADDAQLPPCELSLVVEAGETLRCRWRYRRELFLPDTVKQLAQRFALLLDALVTWPARPVAALSLTTPLDEARTRAATHGPRQDSSPALVHERLAEHARHAPTQIAVVSAGRTLSYGELDAASNRLAHRLRQLGVARDVPVALCIERSVEAAVALFGILKAGGAYVPIEPSLAADRFTVMVEEARLRVLVTTAAAAGKAASFSGSVVFVDDAALEALPATPPPCDATRDSLAYVIFTSGTTGRPKGVAVEHRNLTNYVDGVAERFAWQPGARFATVSTLSADLGNTMLFPALAGGGELHILRYEDLLDAGSFAAYMAEHAIDYLKITPSHFASLAAAAGVAEVAPRRGLVFGGEALRRELIAQLRGAGVGCAVFNHYGPTETTVGVLATEALGVLPATASDTAPLGRPLPNVAAHVLDDELRPVPPGCRGELYIGGAHVARGYLNRPAWTAERFIPDPFTAGARLYRTGDRVRQLASGELEFLGRGDDQVKIRGFRVEPRDIESALASHAGVARAHVVAVEDALGQTALCAFVEPRAPRKLPNNMRIVELNRNETDYIYHELFELQAYLKNGITLRDGDVVLDVGANIGLFTLFASQVARDLQLCSFEPVPRTFAALKANAAAYAPHARVFNLGVSDRPKQVDFTFFPGFSMLSGAYADSYVEKEMVKTYVENQVGAQASLLLEETDHLLVDRLRPETVTVQMRTLSQFLDDEGLTHVDLLKINVEKSELDVLRGIADRHWGMIRQIVAEIDTSENRAAVLELLHARGFATLVEQDRLLRGTQLCYVYAVPQANAAALRLTDGRAHCRELPRLEDRMLGESDLRAFAKDKLPDYMVPASFVLLNAPPLNRNGKLDRQALAAMARRALASEAAAPAAVEIANELDGVVLGAWRDVLGRAQVGLDDNFFELGGNSLKMIRLFKALKPVLRPDVAIVALFEHPTVRSQLEELCVAAPPARALDRRGAES